jgi:hypothetical protein
MDVISICRLRVASLLWQPGQGRWALTAIAKATIPLGPGPSALVPEQEAPNQSDRHFADDPELSAYAPSDLVHHKPRADVVLVGHAFAPRGQSVRALSARVSIGQVDKTIEVVGDRAYTHDGRVTEASPFTKMPLRYELAGGGPGTLNPVGLRADAPPDLRGLSPLPNLQPPGYALRGRGEIVPPASFGPIAATWPARVEKLGHHASSWRQSDCYQRPLPLDLDPAYWNAAPPDQQLAEICGGETLVLEGLSPEHERLAMRLPALRPMAFVDRPGSSAQPVAMRCDTLWIDTDRRICTLTWRGQIALEGPQAAGRVVVTLESASAPASIGLDDRADCTGIIDEAELARKKPTTPFYGHDGAPPSPPPPSSDGSGTLDSVGRPLRRGPTLPFSQQPGRLASPWGSIAPASLDAPAPAARASAQPSPPPPARADEVLDLVWFDPACAGRLRQSWSALLAGLEGRPRDAELDASAPRPEDVEVHREVFEVLSRATAVDAEFVVDTLAAAVRDDGKLVPPLVLVAGELELALDPVAVLECTLALASPHAAGDRSLRESIDAAEELLRTQPVLSSVAAERVRRVREAFAKGKRAVSADHVQTDVERLLLQTRRYHLCSAWGADMIRAVLRSPHGADLAIPAYLPGSLLKRLPMFARFGARLVAEIHLAQDQEETHPCALRVFAVARVATAPRPPARDGLGRGGRVGPRYAPAASPKLTP